MRRTATVTAGICGLVLLAACSATNTKSAPGGLAPHGGPAPAAGIANGAVQAGASGAATAAPTIGQSARSSSTAQLTDVLAVASLIKTASLQVEFAKGADVAAKADAAESIAIGLGGTVYSDDRTAGDSASATLTLKVPPETLSVALDKIAALGHELSRESSTKDVTTEVADVASRVQSAQDSLTRLRILFTQATKIGDIIEIESEISQREADLESLVAQQRALAAQTTLATLQVSLTTKGTASPVPPKRTHYTGFVGGLHHGWDAFTSSASAVAVVAGAVLPFGVLFLALGAGAALVLRRRRQPVPEPDRA